MDILEQLLVQEKQAASLVAEADAEASKRKAAARVAAQSEHAVALKKAAEEVAVAVEAERGRLSGERSARNATYRARLEAQPLSKEELSAAARRFLAGDA